MQLYYLDGNSKEASDQKRMSKGIFSIQVVLIESVESLLSTSTCSIPSDRILIFTEQLSNLLYNYITSGTTLIPRSLRACIPLSHTDMYADIRKKAWIFILVISWFQHTQVGRHSDSVICALTSKESQAPTGQPESLVTGSKCEEPVTKQDAEVQRERDKAFVRILVKKLVKRIYSRGEIIISLGAKKMDEELFETAWARIEGTTIIHKTIDDLDKIIFNYLKRKCGSLDQLLMSVQEEDAEFADLFGYAVKKHLTRPKKSAVCRFFSAVGNRICKLFNPSKRKNN